MTYETETRTAGRPGIDRRQMMAGLVAGCLVPGALGAGVLSPSAVRASDGALRSEHVFGETVLPGPARRVVSLGYTTQDALLALGIAPVAIRQWFGNYSFGVWPWAQPLLGDAQPKLISGEVSMEIVASLQPDLIVGIGSGISRDEYDVLSQIAPVLMQPPGETSFGMRWDAMTRWIGRAVGQEELAGEKVAAVEAIFEAARRRHPDWVGRTAICAYHFGGETGAYIGTDTRATFLAELGFEPTSGVQALAATQGFYARLSPEDLTLLDADMLIWLSATDTASDVVALPLRKTLEAHREGREILAGELMTGALTFGSVLSLPFAFSGLEQDMVAALDGDPATPVPSSVTAGLAP